MAETTLQVQRVIFESFPLTKGSLKAAGYDLKSAFDYMVPARGREVIDTGLKIKFPEGCYGRIAPRSGLAVNYGIDVGAGVVDVDYCGIIKIVLFNHSDQFFLIKRGDRVAQLICEKICYPQIKEVDNIANTVRGDRGFGSTEIEELQGTSLEDLQITI